MQCQNLFSKKKIKKEIINLSSAESVQRVVKVKYPVFLSVNSKNYAPTERRHILIWTFPVCKFTKPVINDPSMIRNEEIYMDNERQYQRVRPCNRIHTSVETNLEVSDLLRDCTSRPAYSLFTNEKKRACVFLRCALLDL